LPYSTHSFESASRYFSTSTVFNLIPDVTLRSGQAATLRHSENHAERRDLGFCVFRGL